MESKGSIYKEKSVGWSPEGPRGLAKTDSEFTIFQKRAEPV